LPIYEMGSSLVSNPFRRDRRPKSDPVATIFK